MDDQVDKLEAAVAVIERDLAVMRSNYATKEDLQREVGALTWKLVTFVCGFGTALVAATYFIASHTAS